MLDRPSRRSRFDVFYRMQRRRRQTRHGWAQLLQSIRIVVIHGGDEIFHEDLSMSMVGEQPRIPGRRRGPCMVGCVDMNVGKRRKRRLRASGRAVTQVHVCRFHRARGERR